MADEKTAVSVPFMGVVRLDTPPGGYLPACIKAALELSKQFMITVEFEHNGREIRIVPEDTLAFVHYRLDHP